MRNAFISNGKYEIFDSDTKFSYYCDNNHLSPPGVERMVPFLKEAFDKTFQNLNL